MQEKSGSKFDEKGRSVLREHQHSGENLFVLFMAPFSQKLEPPQNPGRFRGITQPAAAGEEAAASLGPNSGGAVGADGCAW